MKARFSILELPTYLRLPAGSLLFVVAALLGVGEMVYRAARAACRSLHEDGSDFCYTSRLALVAIWTGKQP